MYVAVDHVAACYRGVWPMSKIGEDTSGSCVRGTLPETGPCNYSAKALSLVIYFR